MEGMASGIVIASRPVRLAGQTIYPRLATGRHKQLASEKYGLTLSPVDRLHPIRQGECDRMKCVFVFRNIVFSLLLCTAIHAQANDVTTVSGEPGDVTVSGELGVESAVIEVTSRDACDTADGDSSVASDLGGLTPDDVLPTAYYGCTEWKAVRSESTCTYEVISVYDEESYVYERTCTTKTWYTRTCW
jgi:hypothetical protein